MAFTLKELQDLVEVDLRQQRFSGKESIALSTTGLGGAVTWAVHQVVGSGGGVSDHSLLSNLGWAASGHTGPISSLAGFDATGLPITYSLASIVVDLADTLPSSLGAASSGVATSASRADHVHPMPSALDVGADPSGTAASAVSSHEAAADPHPDYALESNLATVATSGLYSDLTGTPSLPSPASTVASLGVSAVGVSLNYAREDHAHQMPSASDVGADALGSAASAVSAHEAAIDPHPDYALESSLTAVATSGNYSDLTGLPVVPVNLGDLGDVNTTGALLGEFLQFDGNDWVPAAALPGSGDVSGPPAATDNALVLFSGTSGKQIKNSDWLSVTGTYSLVAYQQISLNGSASNISAVFTPKGTGSLQSHVANGAASGGNNRGIYAVDLQLSRAAATQVASGSYTTISGGQSNTSSGNYSNIGGGRLNVASGSDSTIAGGWLNQSLGVRNSIGGGYSNITNDADSVIGGGRENQATQLRTFVGGGYQNKSLGIYAVVVGGYINEAPGTYSFIGGGGNNTADGVYAIIVGGLSNTGSGDYSYIGGGGLNTTNGSYTTIVGGYQCSATATMATVVGGNANTSSGPYSISGGQSNTASGSHSFACGFSCTADKDYSIAEGFGAVTHYPRSIAFASGNIAAAGDATVTTSVASQQTTTDSPATLTTGAGTPTVANTFVIPENSGVAVEVLVVAKTSDHKVKFIKMFGSFVRETLATSVAQQGSTHFISDGHIDLSTATAAFTVNPTTGAVNIEVTGIASTTLRWVAEVNLITVRF